MAKITAQTPDGKRVTVIETDASPIEAVGVFKAGNPELTKWEIDGQPIKLVNKETGKIDE